MLGAALYIPQVWLTAEARQRAQIPAAVRFQEKWRWALTLLRQNPRGRVSDHRRRRLPVQGTIRDRAAYGNAFCSGSITLATDPPTSGKSDAISRISGSAIVTAMR
jgi:hypothetical protein